MFTTMKQLAKKTVKAAKKPLDAVSGKALEQEFKQYSEMLETILSGMSVKLGQHDKAIKQIKELKAALAALERQYKIKEQNKTCTYLAYGSLVLSGLSLLLVAALFIYVL